MNNKIGFIHTYNRNNGYGDYKVSEEIIGIFYKSGLGSTDFSGSSWKLDDNIIDEKLDKFYQILRKSQSKNTENVSIYTISETEWFENFKKK